MRVRVMDFGIFLPIANNGWIISKNSPQYMPTFELNKEVTIKAENMGLDFVLSMVKFRGYGGETEHWDYAMDSFNMMAGLAAVTERIGIYATVQPLTLHPAMAARMAATIDDISNGRFGMNVVAGWNKYEYSQMGLWPGDEFYNDRYDYAEEWLTVVKGLWDNGRLTHKGKYFDLDDCLCQPSPVNKSNPPIVCAGMSEKGLRFTVKHCNVNFVAGDLEQITSVSAKGKEIAAEMEKEIKTYALYTLITADTDEEAQSIYQHFIDGTDQDSFSGLQTARSNDKAGSTTEKLLGDIYLAPTLTGSPETIVDFIEHLSTNTEVDGLLFAFPDFIKDTDYFEKKILPLIEARGLRNKVIERIEA